MDKIKSILNSNSFGKEAQHDEALEPSQQRGSLPIHRPFKFPLGETGPFTHSPQSPRKKHTAHEPKNIQRTSSLGNTLKKMAGCAFLAFCDPIRLGAEGVVISGSQSLSPAYSGDFPDQMTTVYSPTPGMSIDVGRQASLFGWEMLPSLRPKSSIDDEVASPINCLDEATPSSPSCLNEQHELQQTQAFINSPKITITDSYLLHLIGDFFGKNTLLEGSQSRDVLLYYQESLKQLIQGMSPQSIHDSVEEHKFLITFQREVSEDFLKKIALKIDAAIEIEKTLLTSVGIKPVSKILTASLKDLKPGEAVFFPGGWKGDPSGHGMYYEFIAEGNEHFTLRVYNTGSGIGKFHSKTTVAYKEQYLSFTERKQIPLKNILQKECLQAFLELNEQPSKGITPWSADDIYETLLPAIGGIPSEAVYSEADLRSAQRSGTCSFMSFQSVLRNQFSSSLSSGRLHWLVLFKAVNDYASEHHERLFSHELARRLLDKSLEEFARITKDRFEEGSINSLEMHFAKETLSRIKGELQASEAAYVERIAEEAPCVDMQPIPKQREGVFGRSAYLSDHVKFEDDLVAAKTPPYHSFNLNNYSLVAETIISDLNTLNGHIKGSIDSGDPLTALHDFRRIMEYLPLHRVGNAGNSLDLWRPLSAEQKIEAISALSTLSKLAYRACVENVRLHPAHTQTVEPKTLLAFIKANTMGVQLLESSGIDPYLPITYFEPKAMDILEDIQIRYHSKEMARTRSKGQSPYFRTYDPTLDTTMREIKDYWIIKNRGFYDHFKWYQKQIGIVGRLPYAVSQSVFENEFHDWCLTHQPKERLASLVPRFSSLPKLMQGAVATFDVWISSNGQRTHLPRDLLPSYFYALRDLKYSVEALKELPLVFDNPKEVNSSEFLFVGAYQDQYSSSLTSWNQYVAFFPSREAPLGGYPKASINDLDTIKDWIHVRNAHRVIKSEVLNQLFLLKDLYLSDAGLRREPENLHVIEDLRKTEGVNVDMQTQRELRRILSERGSQVKRTLEYFKKNTESLKDPDYQTLFKLLMFDHGLLLRQLNGSEQDAGHFIALLADFTSSNYHSYLERGNLETAAFFLHLNELFARYIAYAKPNGQEKQVMMDTRHEIREILKKNDLNEHTRALFNQELALCYRGRDHLSEEEIMELTYAAFYSQIIGVDGQYASRENTLAVENLMNRWLSAIEAQCKGENRNRFLNQLVETLQGIPLQTEWVPSPHFPVFITSDGGYRIDMREVKLYRESHASQTALPQEVIGHPLIKKLFGDALPKAGEKIRGNQYAFATKEGKYRVLVNGNQLVLQKSFQLKESSQEKEDWYQYVPVEQIYTPRGEPGPQFKLEGMIKEHVHWASSSHNPQDILVTHPTDHKALYRIQYDNRGDITSITRLYGQQEEVGLVANYAEEAFQEDSVWSFLTQFEDAGYVFLWKDATVGVPQLLEFPRFGKEGLTFKRQVSEGSHRFASANFPGYYLSEKQHLPALKDIPNFLLLENRAGIKKVLIPRQYLIKNVLPNALEKTSSLETSKGHPNRQLASAFIEKQTALSYFLDKKSGSLIPESEEGRFYLSMLYLWKMEYATALHYLEGTKSSIKLLSQEEQDILSIIVMMDHENGDQDPRGTAIRLHASLILLKDQQMREREVRSDRTRYVYPKIIKELFSIYQTYLNQLSNIPAGRLQIDEELAILDAIPYKNEAMLNRLRHLAPLKGKEALAYVAASASQLSWPISQESLGRQPEISKRVSVKKVSRKAVAKPFVLPSIRSFIRACDTIKEDGGEKASVLRPSTLQSLVDGYRLAKGEAKDDDDASSIYSALTGIESDAYAPIDLQRALAMMLPEAQGSEAVSLYLLEALLKQPEKYPSSKEFKKYFNMALSNRYADRKDGIEFLEKAIFVPLQAFIDEKYRNDSIEEAGSKESAGSVADLRQCRGEAASESLEPSSAIAQQYRFSIRSQPPQKIFHPLIHDLSLVGINETVVPPDHHPNATSLDELHSLFDLPVNDSAVRQSLAVTAESIAQDQEAHALPQVHYHIGDVQKWKQFKSSIEESLMNHSTALVQEELSLLQMVNKAFTGQLDETRRLLENLGGSGGPLTIDDLIQLYWRRDAALFHIHNPAFSPEQIIALENQIVTYLHHAIDVQRLNRLLKKCAEIKVAEEQQLPQAEIDELTKQAAMIAITQRTYDPADHPEYLVLEYYMDILLRRQQTDNLNILDIRQGRIAHPEMLGVAVEMIMGGGKSSVLLPLIAMLHADGEHLSIAVMTERLLPSSSYELNQLLGKGFKRSVQVVSFSRETKMDEKTLRSILDQMKSARDKRQVLFMTSDSIESLFLKAIERLYIFAQQPFGQDATFMQEWSLIREIFTLLKTKGRVLLDEADLILNPKRERHFTFGIPVSFNPQEGLLISFLYQTLMTHPHINELMSFDFSPVKKGPPFSRVRYQEQVIPILIKNVISKKCGSADKKIIDFFDGLKAQEIVVIEDYLNNSSEELILQAVSTFPLEVRDLLALAKEEIHVLLPLTCNKQEGIDYGTIPAKDFAIPFHGSNKPAEKSQFKTYEAAGYTSQTYMKNGIRAEFISKKIDVLKAQAIKELREDPEKTLDQTQAALEFRALCGGSSRFSLFSSQPQVEAIATVMNQDITKMLDFVRQFILPQLTTSPLTISTNPQVFNFLFEVVLGFSGTLWNSDTFPPGMRAISENTVTGKTLGILWKQSQGKIHPIKKASANQFAKDLIGKHLQLHHIRAIIDAAGMARGISNEDVARQLLDLPDLKANNINAVVFYDSSEELMILERGVAGKQHSLKPFSTGSTPLKQRLVFYDQPHTTGSDIAQSPDSVGLVTIGKHTILRDLLQSVWRLRGLDKSQRVEFAIDEETEGVIREQWKELTHHSIDGDIELKHLILFTAYNQALLQGDNNYRSLKQKMQGMLRAEAWSAFLDPEIESGALHSLFKDVEELFIEKNTFSPWELFGLPQQQQDSASAIASDIAEWEGSRAFKVLQLLPHAAQKFEQYSVPVPLKEQLEGLGALSLPKLPASINKAAQAHEIEVEQEVEQDEEEEKETEIEMETQTQAEGDVEKVRVQHALNIRRKWNGTSFNLFQPISIAENAHLFQNLSKDTKFPVDEEEVAFNRNYYPPEAAALNIVQFYPEKGVVPFVAVGDAFNQYSDLAAYADVFDPALISTINMMPVNYNSSSKAPYQPFNYDQKQVGDLLFVKKPEGLTAVMLDVKDSLDFQIILPRHDIDFETAIYNFELGLHAQGKRPIASEELQQDPMFVRLVVQAKFFNGETYYTPTEMQVLEAWIKEKGVERMRALFCDHILLSPAKATSRFEFPASRIGKLFKPNLRP